MKRSRAFVPTTGQLEDRVALSTVHFTPAGLPIFTTAAAHNVANAVHNAYVRFAHDGFNFARLNSDLIRAVNPVPYNVRDGLTATMSAEVSALQTSMAAGAAHPLLASQSFVATDIENFVTSEVTVGIFALR